MGLKGSGSHDWTVQPVFTVNVPMNACHSTESCLQISASLIILGCIQNHSAFIILHCVFIFERSCTVKIDRNCMGKKKQNKTKYVRVM